MVDISAEDEDNPIVRASAAVKNALLNYRLRKSIPWFQVSMGAYQDAQVVGVCVSYQYWKYNAKKGIDQPCIDLRPVENIRIDPGSDWCDPINSSPYVIDMLAMRVMDVRADEQPGSDDRAAAVEQAGGRDDPGRPAVPIATRRARPASAAAPTQGPGGQINEFAIVWVHRVIMEIDGEDVVYYTLWHARAAVQPGAHQAGVLARQAALRHGVMRHRDAQNPPGRPVTIARMCRPRSTRSPTSASTTSSSP